MSRATKYRLLAAFLGLLVLLAGGSAGVAGSYYWYAQPAEVRLKQAQEALQKEAAQRDLMQQQADHCLLLALDSDTPPGPELLRKSRFTQAEATFTQHVQKDPNLALWLAAHLTILAADTPAPPGDDDPNTRLQLADKAIKDNKDRSAKPYLTKAVALMDLKRYDEALEAILDGMAVQKSAPNAADQLPPEALLQALLKLRSLRDFTAAGKKVADLETSRKNATEAQDALEKQRRELADEKARYREMAAKLEQVKKEAAENKDTVAKVNRMLEATGKELEKAMKERVESSTPAELKGRVRFIVEAPAEDARLFVNGVQDSRTTSGVVHEFLTAQLEAGKTYTYTLRVEYTRDGKSVTETKKVTFQPDTVQRVAFRAAPPEK